MAAAAAPQQHGNKTESMGTQHCWERKTNSTLTAHTLIWGANMWTWEADNTWVSKHREGKHKTSIEVRWWAHSQRRTNWDDSDEDYNNYVVGLIRAGSEPCLGPPACRNICVCVSHCRSFLETGWGRVCMSIYTCMQVHTSKCTHSCCRACLANEITNSVLAMLMEASEGQVA